MHWNYRPIDDLKVQLFQRELALCEARAKLLAVRELPHADAARRFLDRSLDGLHDPMRLPGMPQAVRRIGAALRDKEPMLVHGDYDVDGVSGTAMLTRMLSIWGGDASYFVPNRFSDGYGLTSAGVEHAKATGVKLLITVDCGTSSVKEVAELRAHGIDVVITDHHECSKGVLPPALALVNPKLPGSDYPDQTLCGAGIVYKLLQALADFLGKEFRRESLVRVAAIGTVADVVPLLGENRALVYHGLRELSKAASPGLQALIEVSGLRGKQLSAENIGFGLGPRINAAGRMGHAASAIELFLTGDAKRARELAEQLHQDNETRKATEQQIIKEAKAKAYTQCNLDSDRLIVVSGESWHQGVIGIVASRLREQFQRPTLVISTENGTGKGSGRSVPGFHLHECLSSAAYLLSTWGGHEQAVGFSLPSEAVDEFRQVLNHNAQELLPQEAPERSITVDLDLPLEQLDGPLMAFLQNLEPFGAANPEPVFVARGVQQLGKAAAFSNNHLKLRCTGPERSGGFEAIMWRGASRYLDLVREHDRLDIAYQPYYDTYRGSPSLCLKLLDIRPATP